jgi:glycosyltransferase involved in cell wall biosynthesis
MTGAGRHILHVFPGFDVGGVQLRITSVINRFPGRYRHTIAAMNDRFDCLDRVDPGAGVVRLPLNLAKGRSADTFCRIRGHLRHLAPDMLVTYNWGAIEWALVNRLFCGIPHLHMESGFGPEEANRQLRRRVLLRRFALARTKHVIVPSLNLLRIARNSWGLPTDRMLYVPNGVDLARFAAAPDRSILPGWPEGALVVGTVAPMRPEKNLPRLVRAFAGIADAHDARLLLVGDGPERPALEALVRDLGMAERVHFTGYLNAPEKAFGLMDIYAVSSDTEQMPNALIQAMAAARPVAGMDVGDVAHIVARENRPFIAAAGSDEAFRSCLNRLASDAALRAQAGTANLARVRAEFDQDRMFEAYRTLFDGATPESARADLAA